MESRKRADPPHCVNGCEFNGSIKNCNLCSKCFKENEETEVIKEFVSASSPMGESSGKLKSSIATFSSSGDTNNANANPFFGAPSGNTKRFSFSTDYNRVASGSIFKFKTAPEVDVRNFTFGTSTVTNRRCDSCKKRIGLVGFACKCGHLFCGEHRYPEEHKCKFDFKAFERELLRKQNPGLQGFLVPSPIAQCPATAVTDGIRPDCICGI